jgi:hypothetical protein
VGYSEFEAGFAHHLAACRDGSVSIQSTIAGVRRPSGTVHCYNCRSRSATRRSDSATSATSSQTRCPSWSLDAEQLCAFSRANSGARPPNRYLSTFACISMACFRDTLKDAPPASCERHMATIGKQPWGCNWGQASDFDH